MATANPHFDIQHQALNSLKGIQNICIALEFVQVIAGSVPLGLAFSMPALHLYGVVCSFLVAIFAHIVVFSVAVTIGRNIRDSLAAHPRQNLMWLIIAARKLRQSLMPYFIGHGIVLALGLGWTLVTTTVETAQTAPQIQVGGSWLALGIGVACFFKARATLHQGSEYFISLITAGSYPRGQMTKQTL